MPYVALPGANRWVSAVPITPIRVPLTDIFLYVGMPRIVTSSTTGYMWFPDVTGLSTGQLIVSHLKNADSFDNASNSFADYIAANATGDFAFAYNTSGFNAGSGQPVIALNNGTAIGGRQYFLTPVPNNGTAVTTFTCDRLTYSNGGQTLTSESNAISITFPAAVKPYAGSPTFFAYAFWYSRIIDIGGGTWLTSMQWIPNGQTKRTAGCFRSTDLGYTWTYIGEIGAPADVPGSTEGFSEPAICKLSNGNIFATCRTDSLAPMYEATSTDNGVTWSAPVASTHPGSAAPSLITLTNGVTVELAGIGVGGNMTFRFTKDNTTTWRSWDAMAYHNARVNEDYRIHSLVGATTTGYYGIQEISANRVAMVYDYLPGGRPGQPGDGSLEAQIYILEFDVSLT